MKCMSCREDFPRKYIKVCNGCKADYCKECMREHFPCNPELPPEEQPVAEEPEAETILVDIPERPVRKPFNAQVFSQFQLMAGCFSTQDVATLLYSQIKDGLTEDDRRTIMDAWTEAVDTQALRNLPIIMEGGQRCSFDDVCDRVRIKYANGQ